MLVPMNRTLNFVNVQSFVSLKFRKYMNPYLSRLTVTLETENKKACVMPMALSIACVLSLKSESRFWDLYIKPVKTTSKSIYEALNNLPQKPENETRTLNLKQTHCH